MEYVWWRFSTRLFWLPAQGLRQLSRPASDQAVDSSITHNFTICLKDFHEEFSYLFSIPLAVKCITLHISYILYARTSRGRLFWPECNMIVTLSQSILFTIFAWTLGHATLLHKNYCNRAWPDGHLSHFVRIKQRNLRIWSSTSIVILDHVFFVFRAIMKTSSACFRSQIWISVEA